MDLRADAEQAHRERLVVEDLACRPRVHDAPTGDDDGAGREAAHHVEVLFDQQDRNDRGCLFERVGDFVDDLGGDAAIEGNLPEEERLANEAASDFCIPKAQMDSWIARKAPFFSEQDLIGFAKRQGVHPGIAAGQLRNRMNNYKLFQRHLVKVQACITSTATVDGWGCSGPVHLMEKPR